jgi:hypothetical protein
MTRFDVYRAHPVSGTLGSLLATVEAPDIESAEYAVREAHGGDVIALKAPNYATMARAVTKALRETRDAR